MKFIITDPHPSQTYIERNEIALKLSTRKSMLALSFRYLIGLAALGLDFTNTAKGDHFHVMAIAGAVYILFTTNYLVWYIRKRNKFKDQVSSFVGKLAKYPGDAETIINDESVTAVNTLSRSEVKWPLLMTYTSYKTFLFLNTGEELNSGFVVDSRLMEEALFAELLAFVKKKLPEKKM